MSECKNSIILKIAGKKLQIDVMDVTFCAAVVIIGIVNEMLTQACEWKLPIYRGTLPCWETLGKEMDIVLQFFFVCLFIFNLGSGFQKCWVSQKSATQYSAVQVVSCQLHLCDATWFHRGKWEVTKYFSLSPFHSQFQRGGCCQSHSQRSLYIQIPQSRAFLFENK